MSLNAGTKLGEYEIVSLLGAGGMGEVYRAHDAQLGRDVAIKVLPAFLSRDPERLRRFEQEARAAAALNHPNILAVYQMGTHEGSPYMVSELLEGSTLRDRLARGALPIRKAVDYGVQTAHGLAAAHEKGIVHRDLKPENLFVTKDGRLKILDFGLAKLIQTSASSASGAATVTEATDPGVVLGTVGYMSPEQVRGEQADHRTDLFALGAVLYEMLTGKRSFHKPTAAETMSAILNDEPQAVSQVVPGIPPALQRVVQRCLEKNPEQRFHSASDLAFALEALSESGSAATGAIAGHKENKAWLGIGSAVALIAIVAVAGLWMGNAPAPVVESIVQLTHDGTTKSGALVTDGARIYLNEGTRGSYRIVQVSVNGGETAEVATQLENPQIAGLEGDGSALLVLVGPPVLQKKEMWLVPLPAGEPRRLGNVEVSDASLYPDGRILYSVNGALYVAKKDGSEPSKMELSTVYGEAPGISPDGKRLGFTTYDKKTQAGVINEAAEDGTGRHEILTDPKGSVPDATCCPHWTVDGKYVLFNAISEKSADLWAVSEEHHFLGKPTSPVRLTSGPISFSHGEPSRDGRQVFTIGSQRRGELVRYDAASHAFVPYLGGISIVDPTFSRDGKWVAYFSYPDHQVWRSRIDGTDRLQLTYPPFEAWFPRISPDGSQVAFTNTDGSSYVISSKGGTPRKLGEQMTAPDWSPDGNLLAVTAWKRDDALTEGGVFRSEIVDVKSGKRTPVPDTDGKIGPWFATQDTILATSYDQSKLMLYDFRIQKWSVLLERSEKILAWEVSPDLRYFYYSTGGNDPKIFRMRMSDRKIEEVTSLKNIRIVNDADAGTSLSVAPDNSPLLTRDTGTEELYALSIKWK